MDQETPSDLQDTQQASPSNTPVEREDSLSQIPNALVILQDPSNSNGRRVNIQEPTSILHSRRVSIQEPPSSAPSPRKVIIQESPSSAPRPRKVSIQEPPSSAPRPRKVSIQEPPSSAPSSQRVSIQEPPSSAPSSQRVSIQEPSPSVFSSRRVSAQKPSLLAFSSHRVSAPKPSPSAFSSRRVSTPKPSPSAFSSQSRVSIQESSPSAFSSRRVSAPNPSPSAFSSHRVSIQESSKFNLIPRRYTIQVSPSFAYNQWARSQKAVSGFYGYQLTLQDSHLINDVPSKPSSSEDEKSRLSLSLSHNLAKRQTRPSIDVPPSVTQSPEASIKSMDWDDNESLRKLTDDTQSSQSTLSHVSSSSLVNSPVRLQKRSGRPSMLPIAPQLLLEAKKLSRQLSLVLTLAGMMVMTIVSFGQPWIHFQVPLRPPGDPAGSQTIPIDTILFLRCSDVSCLHEDYKNAYLLDVVWTCFIVSGITSFCICAGLISTFLFPSTSFPMMDILLLMCSLIAGTSILLGILFYLIQAKKYLQEGMTYTLGISFYLAWAGVFLFLMIGLFSYLNYINFWSILALHGIWA